MKKSLFLVLVSFIMLSGCTTEPVMKLKHNVVKEYNKDVTNLYVISNLAHKQKDFNELLQKSMLQEAKGIELTYVSVTGVEEPGSFLKQAQKLKATHALTIKPNGGTVNIFEEILSIKYELDLIDLQSMARVWRANIDFNPFMRDDSFINSHKRYTPIWDERSSGPLAKKIFEALRNDGLLPSLN